MDQGTSTDSRGERVVKLVDCGSSSAKATLVSSGEDPSKAIACPTLDTQSAHDYNVLVDGKDFCARPKSAGASSVTSTSAATSAATSAIPAAFVSSLNRIETPYKAAAAAILTELRQANSQSDAVLAANFGSLAKRIAPLSTQLAKLTPPAAVQDEFTRLQVGTQRIEIDLQRIRVAALAHSATAARSAAKDLNLTFVAVANAIDGLKRKGVR